MVERLSKETVVYDIYKKIHIAVQTEQSEAELG